MTGEDGGPIVAGFRRIAAPGPLPESDPLLVERLRDEIGRAGPIPFARFMEVALHDPARGYYATAPRPGRAGDFLTAPEAHPIYGWTVARAIGETWELLGRPDPFVVVEHGAGSGALAVAILDGLRRAGSPLLGAVRYEPVELAAARLAELEARLAEAGFAELLVPPEVRSPTHAPAAGPTGAPSTPSPASGVPAGAAGVDGIILANELLDALPVHRVVVEGGRLRELLVGWEPTPAPGRFVDVPADPTTPALEARLTDERVELAEGQRAEICLALDAWVAGAAARLGRGILLAVDYGHPAGELYGASRRDGTLRTYLRHMVGTDPYAHVGRQDLTAHVDLTALVRAGERAGLRHLGTTTQAAFLIGSGIEELVAAVRADPGTDLAAWTALRSAVARLLDPAATGGFRVVALGRDLPDGASLAGLRFRAPGPAGPASPSHAPDDSA